MSIGPRSEVRGLPSPALGGIELWCLSQGQKPSPIIRSLWESPFGLDVRDAVPSGDLVEIVCKNGS